MLEGSGDNAGEVRRSGLRLREQAGWERLELYEMQTASFLSQCMQRRTSLRISSGLLSVIQISYLLNVNRTLVYVEGNASMDTYQDAEGKNRTSLNIIQSKHNIGPLIR